MNNLTYKHYLVDPGVREQIEHEVRSARAAAMHDYLVAPLIRRAAGLWRVTAAYAGAIVALLVLHLGGCAALEPPKTLVSVPNTLSPAANESLSAVVAARGVQIYECRAQQNRPGTYEWAFVAPEADLYDVHGQIIGRHYGGPYWEANDGSKFAGALKTRVDAPAVDAIPWLLLTAKSAGVPGAFDDVTSVQRVNTVGGVAPEHGCSHGAAGASARVPYTADYYFFRARGASLRMRDEAVRTYYRYSQTPALCRRAM